MRMRSVVVGLVGLLLLPVAAPASSNFFRSAFTDTNSSNATGIATGDFDNDGFVDVLTSNAGQSNEISILPGFGDGTVTVLDEIELSSLPSALLLNTFDGDTIPDLVVGLGNENAITFLRGRGDSQYFDTQAAPIAVGGSPAGLATVDFNGDGKRDVIVANDGGDSAPGSVSFLRGDGLGGFTLLLQTDPSDNTKMVEALPADLGTRALAVGNIDADAGLEVLAVNSRANNISIFDGDGSGFFTPGGTLTAAGAPQDIALADLDGDGKLDLILANSNDDAVSIQRGNGDKTFGTPTLYRVGTAPNRLILADLDGNGTLDVATTNARSGDISVLRGDGLGGFGEARTWVAEAEPQVLAVGDFNGDQKPDLVASAQGGGDGGQIAILRNRGDGLWHAVEDIRVGNGPSALAAADLDDDAQPDLISAGDDGAVVIQYARGADGFSAPQTITIGGRTLAVLATDLNNDGQPDIAAVDNDNSRVVVALATGAGTFAATQMYSVSDAPSALTAGDFNADGRVDLAVAAGGMPGKVSVLLQQANGSFGPARSTTVGDTPVSIVTVRIADADNQGCDQKDDLVVANQASATVSVLRSQGDGTFVSAQELPGTQVGTAPHALAVGDFNRDGIDDFAVSDVFAAGSTPSFRSFLGACNGPFTFKASARAGDLISAMVARDFTGDGLVDIGLINQTSNAMRVLTGLGDGRFNNNTTDAVSRMPVNIAAADFDGDGRYDAVTANSDPSANNVSVLYNCTRDDDCAPFPLPTPIPGKAALRGDGNNDGRRSAADFVAVAREVMDGDGVRVEDINNASANPTGYPGDPGVDANGDGVVTAQDRWAVARLIFGGA